MKIIRFTIIIALIISTAHAQDSPQWQLPDGAKMRLGKGTANDIAYSTDGTKFAVATRIGIWIYDAHTGEELNLLKEGIHLINAITFTQNGHLLVNDDRNRNLSFWDVDTGMRLRTIPLQNFYNAKTTTFSPDAKTMANVFPGPIIRLWDTESGKELYPIVRISFFPTSLAFSQDGKKLAAGNRSGVIMLWDVETGDVLHLFEGHTDQVNSLAFSPDGKKIASGSSDETVRLWDVESGAEIQISRWHDDAVQTVEFSPDGETIASSSLDNTLILQRAVDRVQRHEITSLTHYVNHLTFSPDSQTLASISWYGTIHSWNVLTGIQKFSIDGHFNSVNSLAFGPNGSKLVSGGRDTYLHLWDTNTGTHQQNLTTYTDVINSIAFSPDGNTIASGSEDGVMLLWDAHTKQVNDVTIDVEGVVESVAFSSDGSTVAGAVIYGNPNASSIHYRNSDIKLFDVDTGEELHTITAYNAPIVPTSVTERSKPGMHSSPVRCIAISPNGDMLASGSYDRTVRLWDMKTGVHLRLLAERVRTIKNLVFSPDGNMLAGVNYSDEMFLWDVANGMQRTLNIDNVNSLAFSQDGVLAIGGYQTIGLWNVASDTLIHTFTADKHYIDTIAFSPDGSTLASAGSDGTILLWDTSDLTLINTTIGLSPINVVSPVVGQQLTLSLNIGGGQNVSAYQATVNYDPTALRYVDSNIGDYLPDTAFVINPDPQSVDALCMRAIEDSNPEPQTCSVTLAATAFTDEVNNAGTLATITFEVIAVKPSTVSLSNVLLTDSAGNSTKPIINASTEITAPVFVREDVNQDGVVNILDLTFIAANFGNTGKHPADVNGDGIVNIVDLALVAAAIGNNADDAAAPDRFPLVGGVSNPETVGVVSEPQSSSIAILSPTTVQSWLRDARQLNLSDSAFQRGILFLENLLKFLAPKQTALLPNYPNPFNPETWIPYRLASTTDVSITIYTSDGKIVRRLTMGHQAVGIHQEHWDGKNAYGEKVASGIYFYTLTAGDYTATRKMSITK